MSHQYLKVKDPSGRTALTYWWNPETNVTTALGEQNPSLTQYSASTIPGLRQPVPQSLGQSMVTYLGLGFGMSMAFALVGAFFR